MTTRRHWVIVVSRDHARRGLEGGFIMANHGKRDGILVYSPTTTYPRGEPLRAITMVGEVTGDAPEPNEVIAGGFRRAAALREIDPLPRDDVREHLHGSRIRCGRFESPAADAEAVRALVDARDA